MKTTHGGRRDNHKRRPDDKRGGVRVPGPGKKLGRPRKDKDMMKNVTITKGVHTGKTGDAVPAGAIGPINNRTLLVRVTLHDGSGQVELPLDAIK